MSRGRVGRTSQSFLSILHREYPNKTLCYLDSRARYCRKPQHRGLTHTLKNIFLPCRRSSVFLQTISTDPKPRGESYMVLEDQVRLHWPTWKPSPLLNAQCLPRKPRPFVQLLNVAQLRFPPASTSEWALSPEIFSEIRGNKVRQNSRSGIQAPGLSWLPGSSLSILFANLRFAPRSGQAS